MSQTVIEMLSTRTKEQLEVILDYFKMPLKRSAKKKDLLCELADFLHSDPELWIRALMEADLMMLQRLCSAGPGTSVRVVKPDFPTVMEVLHFVEAEEIDEDYLEISIEPAIYEIVSPFIDKIITEKEEDGSFEIERLILGCLNIYGVVPLRSFVDALFEALDVGNDAEKFTSRIASCPLLRIYQEEYHGEYYIASPFVDNFKEILELRKMTFKNLKKYAKMKPEDAIAGGSGSPFCYFGGNTAEGKALEQMLSSIGYEGEGLKKALHTVWMSSQYAIDEDATEILFSPVTDRQDSIPSFEMFRDCIETIVKYSNSVPKWLLKGQTSDRCGKMLISVKVDELSGTFSGTDPYMQLFELGFACRPAEPDEPCPCGSGFPYRLCHGKNLN